MQADPPSTREAQRVRLNVGGRRFETTVATLTSNGSLESMFSSLLQHTERGETGEQELFIDRDGEAFGPLLNFLRTQELIIPPSTSEAALRLEADYYCINLPPVKPSHRLRTDGLYLSFGAARWSGEGGGTDIRESDNVQNDTVRAYLHFHATDPDGTGEATLGRREADGQWSALRCRYLSCWNVDVAGLGMEGDGRRSRDGRRSGNGWYPPPLLSECE